MVQAADLGTNIQRLYQHEPHFRTNGRKGERLSSVDCTSVPEHVGLAVETIRAAIVMKKAKMTSWGFKTFTEFLLLRQRRLCRRHQVFCRFLKIAGR
ncbi:hypothetical protein ACLK1S_18355 [Escherichia coli]